MIAYKITKYNPKNILNGKYSVHEWTSISDIGKLFDDGMLTYNQYIQVERRYIDCCIELLQIAEISKLSVSNFENYKDGVHLPNILNSEREIRSAIMYCLREKCWAKLEGKNFYIHFGYDYNMYVGTNIPNTFVYEISEKHNLFCEEKKSPYSCEEY